MSTDFGLNKSMAEKEAEKRRQLVDEMYGTAVPTEEPKEEEKGELSQLFNAYIEHRKQKQQPALKNILGR